MTVKDIALVIIRVNLILLVLTVTVGVVNLYPYYQSVAQVANDISLYVSTENYIEEREADKYVSALSGGTSLLGNIFPKNTGYMLATGGSYSLASSFSQGNANPNAYPRISVSQCLNSSCSSTKNIVMPNTFNPDSGSGLIPNRGERVKVDVQTLASMEIVFFSKLEVAIPIKVTRTATTLKYYRW